jgi:hypothetical protein
MPLLDHFHPPLKNQRHWENFHARWAGAIADALNACLPERYVAEIQVTLSAHVEVDVATQDTLSAPVAHTEGNGGVAVATGTYAPPVATLQIPAAFPDNIGVRVIGGSTGPHLVAAVELVSPGNKDRTEARRTFAAKCVSYLASGVGVIIVDVVTERLANMHNEIVSLMRMPDDLRYPHEGNLYAVAYRPVRREGADLIDAWPSRLALGEPLVTLPLAVRGLGCLPVDLDSTYTEALRLCRIEA